MINILISDLLIRLINIFLMWKKIRLKWESNPDYRGDCQWR